MDQRRLMASLLTDAQNGPTALAAALVREVHQRYQFPKATVFFRQMSSDDLVLVAQSGLKYREYSHYEIPSTTMAAAALASGEIVSLDSTVAADTQFSWDPHVLSECANLFAAAIPFGMSSRPADPRVADLDEGAALAVLCIYSTAELDMESITNFVGERIDALDLLLQTALDSAKLRLRRLVVSGAASQRSPRETSNQLLTTLFDQLSFKEGAVFLYDQQSELTYSAAAANWHIEDLPATMIVQSPIVHDVLTSNQSQVVARPVSDAKIDELETDVGCEISAACVLPLLPHDPALEFGVLVLANPSSSFDLDRRSVGVSWSDYVLSMFAADMLGVIFHQLQSGRDLLSRYERALHGAKTNLNGVTGVIQNIRLIEGQARLAKKESQVPHEVLVHLEDAEVWVGDLRSQIDRQAFANRSTSLVRQAVRLWEDVLFPLSDLAERTARARQLRGLDFQFDVMPGRDLSHMPPVWTHKDALNCVLRNLLDNSMKYHNEHETVRVRVGVGITKKIAEIAVSDSGISIPASERDRVFDLGFRGKVPRARVPDGLGIGLADCRAIMEKLGGEIRLEDETEMKWTTFSLRLPLTA